MEREVAFTAAIEKEKEAILVLFHNALWLGKEMVAARKSQSLADHVAAVKGGGVSSAYRNRMACAEMQNCLASEDAVALQALMEWGLDKLATLAQFYGTDRTLHQTGERLT